MKKRISGHFDVFFDNFSWFMVSNGKIVLNLANLSIYGRGMDNYGRGDGRGWSRTVEDGRGKGVYGRGMVEDNRGKGPAEFSRQIFEIQGKQLPSTRIHGESGILSMKNWQS